MMRRHPLIILLIPLLLSSCGKPDLFSSPSPLGLGVAGKSWADPVFLELSESSPAVNSEKRSANGFGAAAVTDTRAYLAASFYEASSTKFKGYGRLYEDGTGWAAAGTDFAVIATGTGDLGHVTMISNSGGFSIASFFETASDAMVTVQNGGGWQTATTASGLGGRPTFAATQNMSYGPAVAGAVDELGRAYMFFNADGAVIPTIYMEYWEPASGVSVAAQTSYTQSVDTSGAAHRLISAQSDGKQRVCVINENSQTGATRKAYARCLHTFTSSPGSPVYAPLASDETQPISNDKTHGHDIASDGAGTVAAVFYQEVSGVHHVVANLASNGTWQASPTQISADMASGYVAISAINASSTVLPDLKPGVVHLGKGYFLAAWVGINVASKTARLYYSVYDPGTESWAAALPMGDETTYVTRPPFESFHLFSNQNANAGIAVRSIKTEGASSADDTREVIVGRYHFDYGWISLEKKGNGCKPSSAAVLAACTHRPVGLILATGTSVVLFQDQDTSGNFRVAGVEFK